MYITLFNKKATGKFLSALFVALAFGGVGFGAWAQEPTDSIGDLHGDLEELVITAKKEVVRSDGAQLTYDLDQDDSSKGQTLLDALRKVPLITVDGDDNIYIKGSQNFRIYVNGKEEPMLTANYQKVFKMMPAEAVSKIEVITEPGARYDAEGTAGILNLVTERKQSKDGYTANVSLSAGAQQASGSLYGRFKKNRVTADANVNYASNGFAPSESGQRMSIINSGSDENRLQQSHISQRMHYGYLGGMLNLSWEPTDRDLLSYGMNVSWIDARLKSIDSKISMYNSAGALQWQMMQRGHGSLDNTDASGNISYRHLFGDDGKALTTAYRFSFGKNRMLIDYLNEVTAGTYPTLPYKTSDGASYEREHTATIDYENPFGDNHRLEAGAKGIWRRNSSLTTHLMGEADNEMVDISDYRGGISQVQDVYAAYAAYRGTFGNVSLNGGLRYEHTYMGLDFDDATYQNFRTNLDDVTPNAAVSYMFGPANNLRLAYQMRISRPNVSQLNPGAQVITQNLVMIGNPDLESVRSNSVTLTYSNFTPTLGGNVSLSYTQANNAIESITYYENEIGYQSYANVGRNSRVDLTAFINWNINPRMSASVNGSINYTDINAPSRNMHNSGWKGNYGVNWNYTGPWQMKYTLYGGQSTGHISLQDDFKGWYYYGLSIRKAFLKDDALSITVNAGNFLTKYTRFKSITNAGDYRSTTRGYARQWNVGVTVAWKFGQLKDTVKQTDARLDNDDRNSTAGSGANIGSGS